jgi:hypothetical protein
MRWSANRVACAHRVASPRLLPRRRRRRLDPDGCVGNAVPAVNVGGKLVIATMN